MTEPPPEAQIGPLQRILDANPSRIAQRATRQPQKEFLILFTARTGSSHLAELLTSARVGDVREWLNPDFLPGQARHFGATTFDEYFARMRSVCPNGVFGQKMTIWFYETFSREVRLEDHFDFAAPSIFLYREDLIDQALSLTLANHRKVFHQVGDMVVPLPAVEYDPLGIMRYAEKLHLEEQRLRAFLERHGASPRYVSYEEFTAAEPRRVVEAVARLLNLRPELERIGSRHRKLDDAEHRLQLQRFVAEQASFCDNLRDRRSWLPGSARAAPLLDAASHSALSSDGASTGSGSGGGSGIG